MSMGSQSHQKGRCLPAKIWGINFMTYEMMVNWWPRGDKDIELVFVWWIAHLGGFFSDLVLRHVGGSE